MDFQPNGLPVGTTPEDFKPRKLTKTQRKSMKAAMNEPWQTSKKDTAMLKGYKNIMSLLARGNCGVQMA